jgi:hypothetical protein
MDEFDAWLDELLQKAEAKQAASNLRRENPYALHLIKVLAPYGTNGLARVDAIYRVWQLRRPTDVNMPKEVVGTVQSAYNHHCADSNVFKRRSGKPEEALFHPVGGKGSGRWAVDLDKAKAWLKGKRLEA